MCFQKLLESFFGEGWNLKVIAKIQYLNNIWLLVTFLTSYSKSLLFNMVAISHMWLLLFKCNLNEIKIKFFSCSSHISSAQEPHRSMWPEATVLNSVDREHFLPSPDKVLLDSTVVN